MSKKFIPIYIIIGLITISIGIVLFVNFSAIQSLLSGVTLYTPSMVESVKEESYNQGATDKEILLAEIDSYKSSLEKITFERNNLNEELVVYKEDNLNKQNQINLLTDEINFNLAEIEKLNEQIINLKLSLNKKDKEIEECLYTISSLKIKNSNLEIQVEEYENQILNNNLTISSLNTTISELEKTVTYYETYILTLENQVNILAIFEFNGSVYSIIEVDETNLVNIEDPKSTELVIFNYWTVDGEKVDLSTYQVLENTKFVANVTYKNKVQFYVDDVLYDTQILDDQNLVNIPDVPIKDKYNFVGWSIDGVNIVDLTSYVISTNTQFVAVFENKYGLFNTDTGENIYSWNELIEFGYLSENEGVLSSGVNIKRLSGDLRIDNEIVSISDNTFYGCSGLTSVLIGEGVETIGNNVFTSCTELRDVVMYNNVEQLGNYAFSSCEKLKNIILSDSLKQLGLSIFHRSSSLEFVCIENCYYLSSNINDCFMLYKVAKSESNYTISENCKFIYDYAFEGSEVVNLTIPSNVIYIGGECFRNCLSLNSINMSFVKDFGSSLFYGCSSLKYVYLSDSITEIKYGMFNGCTSLITLNIPDNVLSIKESAFKGCSSLQEIKLPVSLEKIGNLAFSGCISLETIFIPKSVIYLAEDTDSTSLWIYSPFYRCDKIQVYCEISSPLETWGNCYCYYTNSDVDKLNFKYNYTYEQYLAEISA